MCLGKQQITQVLRPHTHVENLEEALDFRLVQLWLLEPFGE